MIRKKFIVIISFIILFNVIAIVGWLYLISAISQEGGIIVKARTEIAINEERTADNKSLESSVEGIREDKEKIDSVFLDKQNIIDFIENIEVISEIAGTFLTFNDINIDDEKDPRPSLKLNVKGEFSQVFKFLTLIENVSYGVSVENFNFDLLRTTKEGANEWLAIFNIRINNFVPDRNN